MSSALGGKKGGKKCHLYFLEALGFSNIQQKSFGITGERCLTFIRNGAKVNTKLLAGAML